MFGVEASMDTCYYKVVFILEVIYCTIYECWRWLNKSPSSFVFFLPIQSTLMLQGC
jgi:hypothetical protein